MRPDEPVAAAQMPPPLPVVEAAADPFAEISLQNGLAVRVSMIASGLGVLLLGVAGVAGNGALQSFASLLLALGSGFFAVYLYRLRSGKPLSVLSGARLGWITGVFSFLIVLVLMTLTFLALSDPTVRSAMQKEMEKAGRPGDFQMLDQPAELVLGVATIFVTLAMMGSVGGAMGAKLLGGEEPRP
ncbi:MAG: hypothetical protein K2X03_01575 [Bryobacteraceae bacterium]|nr:hypothetical protein [Bryobacteraceae bacterium]